METNVCFERFEHTITHTLITLSFEMLEDCVLQVYYFSWRYYAQTSRECSLKRNLEFLNYKNFNMII